MGNCIKRSNALNNYSPKPIIYREAMVYPSFMAGIINVVTMIIFGTIIFCPPLQLMMRKVVKEYVL
jgi:hypothetical protein